MQETWMQVLPAKRPEENCIGKYSKGLRMENGELKWGTFCKSVWNNFETQV